MGEIKGYKSAIVEDVLRQLGIERITRDVEMGFAAFGYSPDEEWSDTGVNFYSALEAGDVIHFREDHTGVDVFFVIPEWDYYHDYFKGSTLVSNNSGEKTLTLPIELPGIFYNSSPVSMVLKYYMMDAEVEPGYRIDLDEYSKEYSDELFDVIVRHNRHIDRLAINKCLICDSDGNYYEVAHSSDIAISK